MEVNAPAAETAETNATGIEATVARLEQEKSEDQEIVQASYGSDGAEAAVLFDTGKTLDDLIDSWGEETVREMALRAARIKLQGNIRSLLKLDYDQDAVEADLSGWTPNDTRSRSSNPRAAILNAFTKVTDDAERDELVAYLKSLIADDDGDGEANVYDED